MPSSQALPAFLIDENAAAPVPPSWPPDQDDIRVRLGDARRDGSHAGLRHQLDTDPGARIDLLEIENQLRQIFDGIDVVVRRRARSARLPASPCADARYKLLTLCPGNWPPSPGLAP